MRTAPVLVSLALGATLLTGCGQSDTEAYCDELKKDKASFDALNGSTPDFSKLDQAIASMHALADKSPDEVASDWKTVDGALTTFTTALDDAGVSLSDLGAIAKGQVPKGVDPQKLQAVAPKLQKLNNGDVTAANKAIEKHAKDACEVQLGISG